MGFAQSLSTYLRKQGLIAGQLASSNANKFGRDDISLGTQFVSYSARGGKRHELIDLVEKGSQQEFTFTNDEKILSESHKKMGQIIEKLDNEMRNYPVYRASFFQMENSESNVNNDENDNDENNNLKFR